MSDEKQIGSETLEKDTTVVISPEDCNAALDFWRHFDIPITPSFQAAMDTFAKDPSFDNQCKVKLEVSRAISITDHEAFKDEMFQRIADECSNIVFEMEFDQDFETTVAEEK